MIRIAENEERNNVEFNSFINSVVTNNKKVTEDAYFSVSTEQTEFVISSQAPQKKSLRVDSDVSEAFKQSMLYKLAYYGTNYIGDADNGYPCGYDSIRTPKIRFCTHKLRSVEEVFTSSSQLVRIFRVNKDTVF